MAKYQLLPDFTFKTIMLLKCTYAEYAGRFIESGNMRFGTPKEWIGSQDSSKQSGRIDPFEGVFAALSEPDPIPINYLKTIRSNVMIKEIAKLTCLQSEDALGMRTYCLFGINDNMFPNQWQDKTGQDYQYGIITRDYFEDFANGSDNGGADLDSMHQPALIMISNPHEFFSRVRRFFLGLGLTEQEVLIQPVHYINKREPHIIDESFPTELFTKDTDYSHQSEIRIVLHTNNQEVLKLLNDRNGIVDIGAMGDIAHIEKYYFDKDLTIQRSGNMLMYNLPEPVFERLEDLPIKRALAIAVQFQRNQQPQEFESEDEELRTKQSIGKILWDKHRIRIDWETGKITIVDNPEGLKELRS